MDLAKRHVVRTHTHTHKKYMHMYTLYVYYISVNPYKMFVH